MNLEWLIAAACWAAASCTGDNNRSAQAAGTPLQSHLTQYSQYGTYRAVSDLLASRHDPLARADGVAHAAPVVRVLMMVLWLGL